jgi:hypothetical protein
LSHESYRQRCPARDERLVDYAKTTIVRAHEYFGLRCRAPHTHSGSPRQRADSCCVRSGFRPTFGDSRNSHTLCGVWTRRWKGGALAASDSLSRVHDVSPDGTALSHASPPRRVTWSQAEALSRATHAPTPPRHALVPAHLSLPPGPAARGELAGSGG